MRRSNIVLAILILIGLRAVADGTIAPASKTSIASATTEANTDGQTQRKVSASLTIDSSSTLAPGSSGSAGEGLSQSGLYRLDLAVPFPGAFEVSLRTGYSQEYTYVKNDEPKVDI